MNKINLFIVSIILLLIFRFILFFLTVPNVVNNQKVEYLATISSIQEQYFRQFFLSKYSNQFSYLPIKIFFPKNFKPFEAEKIKLSGNINIKVIKDKQVYSLRNLKIVKISEPNIIYVWVTKIQKKITDFFYLNMSAKDAGLLLGIIFGIKAKFDNNFSQLLSSTGVMHVIAASGMNVTMVSSFIFFLAISSFKRQKAIFLSFIFLTFYILISGFQPSIVRAFIMILFSFLAQILGRQNSGFYGLFLAFFIMVFYDPLLIFSISFELSFLSTLGILMFKPILFKNHFLDDFTTTFSAQILSLPIIIASFGNYGILSILVNVLVLWTIPPLMILGGISAILAFFIAPLAILALILAKPFLWWFENVVEFLGSFNLNVKVGAVNGSLILGYYLLVLGIWIFLKKKKQVIS